MPFAELEKYRDFKKLAIVPRIKAVVKKKEYTVKKKTQRPLETDIHMEVELLSTSGLSPVDNSIIFLCERRNGKEVETFHRNEKDIIKLI